MFRRLFGSSDKGGSSAPPPQPGGQVAKRTIDTIQSLADHEEQLEKRKELLEKRMEAELQKARDYNNQKKKSQALQCLKKKKMLENEVVKIDNMIMRVIEQRNMMEGQRTTVEVVSTMHRAAMDSKQNMKAMKIENVDKVMDEINESNEQMSQINDVMANPIGGARDIDEDELNEELEMLEETELDQQLLQPAATPSYTPKLPQQEQQQLPSVPQRQQKAPPKKTQEEEELEALQAEMAL
mmetsp:Transcript_22811/g.63056  ORF Transcript_22811/g.63056 Transcript_22811/m.63056 type:complete len:240 (-) Transcript_22811:686-1405(-)